MRRRRLLVAASAVQLGLGVTSMTLAIRRRYAYDVLGLSGRREHVARSSLAVGTALSAPAWMLAGQGVLVALLAAREDRRAARGLGVLGAVMVAGYVGERHVRQRLAPSGWHVFETPLILAGSGLAGAMAALGLTRSRLSEVVDEFGDRLDDP